MAVASDGEAFVTADFTGVGSVELVNKTTAGSNRLAIVHCGSSSFISGITGGATWQEIVEALEGGFNFTAELWRAVAPPTAATTVTVEFAATATGTVACSSYNGVDQGTPVSGDALDTGVGVTPSVGITAASDEMVVDAMAQDTATVPTVGAGQTVVVADNSTGVGPGVGGSYEAGTGGTTTMSWSGATSSWAMVAAALNAIEVGQAGDNTPSFARRRWR